MTKKNKKNRSRKEQKKKPREPEMAEKDGDDSGDSGLDDDVSLLDVQHSVLLLEKTISDLKVIKDQDHDHDHTEASYPKAAELLPMLEEELRILKSKVKDSEKEEQELRSVEKKGSEGIEEELVAMVAQLEISMKTMLGRINDMKKYEDSGSVDMDDLETIQLAGEKLEEHQKNPDELLARLMREVIFPIDGKGTPVYRTRNSKFSSQELKKMKQEMETRLDTTVEMQRSLDKFEEKFRRYNLPKREIREPLQPYLRRLRQFMQSVWQESAEKCRQMEHRSLIEWMVKLKNSGDEERRDTFRGVKIMLDYIGVQISKSLIECFLFMSVSTEKEVVAANLFEIESIIRCLTVERSSVMINSFVAVVEFFDRTIRTARPSDIQDPKGKRMKEGEIKKSESQIEKENALLHLILIEVLRLEVSFSYPDLPMMLTDEVFLAMGTHLTDNVFEDKLNRIGATIDGLKSEFLAVEDKDSLKNFFEQMLDLGVQEIWNELDLKPRTS